jgi:hypothetical protein
MTQSNPETSSLCGNDPPGGSLPKPTGRRIEGESEEKDRCHNESTRTYKATLAPTEAA